VDRPTAWEALAYKLSGLAAGDFFICSHSRQRPYYQAWLSMAGVDVREPVLAVVPMALSPELPHRGYSDVPTFVSAGVFHPWLGRQSWLGAVASVLEREGAGRLLVVGGDHPSWPYHTSDGPGADLEGRASVELSGLLAYEELVQRLLGCDVALDLAERSPERELAFPMRSIPYLWCGLGLVHNRDHPLAEDLRTFEAGWVVDDNVAATIERILATPAEVERKGQNAQRLARQRFSWGIAGQELAAFCRSPQRRASKVGPAEGVPRELASVSRDLGKAGAELKQLHEHVERLNGLVEEKESELRRLGQRVEALGQELATVRAEAETARSAHHAERERLTAELAGVRDHLQRIRSSLPYRIYLRLRRMFGSR
jgi:hypothetical protein